MDTQSAYYSSTPHSRADNSLESLDWKEVKVNFCDKESAVSPPTSKQIYYRSFKWIISTPLRVMLFHHYYLLPCTTLHVHTCNATGTPLLLLLLALSSLTEFFSLSLFLRPPHSHTHVSLCGSRFQLLHPNLLWKGGDGLPESKLHPAVSCQPRGQHPGRLHRRRTETHYQASLQPRHG